MQFQQLLNNVRNANLSNSLSLRMNRAEMYDQKRPQQMSTEFQKKQALQNRLKRGRLMHQKHYKTEKERLEAEEKEMSAAKKANLVDFESLLKNYPKKFDVSKCQSTERTFPSCTSPVKAPVEMMTHLELIKS